MCGSVRIRPCVRPVQAGVCVCGCRKVTRETVVWAVSTGLNIAAQTHMKPTDRPAGRPASLPAGSQPVTHTHGHTHGHTHSVPDIPQQYFPLPVLESHRAAGPGWRTVLPTSAGELLTSKRRTGCGYLGI